MKTSSLNQKRLPLVVEAEPYNPADLRAAGFIDLWLKEPEFLRKALTAHGALLLRGAPPINPSDFARFVREFSGKSLIDYAAGASPRVKLGDGVYTSTEYPSSISLSLHNELSYTYRYPSHLYFCCVRPAESGGETPLADSRAILKKIDKDVVRKFRSKGVRYVRNLHGGAGSGYSWQEAFETDDRREVEAYCRAGGILFRWREDGGLTLNERRPATATHPLTGEEVWFNQAEGFHPSALDAETYEIFISSMKEEEFRLNSSFGDGTPLSRPALDHIRETTLQEAAVFEWRAGDILILDNLLTAHGRMAFRGQRRILLAMT